MGEERQYLKHGKALCGKVFAKFVETFNWLVDFGTNLRGDADVNEKQGHIVVDRSDPRHPVIRYVGDKREGSGTGGDMPEDPDEPYDPTDPEGPGSDKEGGVKSVNSEDGALNVIGGDSISVTTDGKTIRISYEAGKEPDPDPQPTDEDPCAHDPSNENGGVSPQDESTEGGAGATGGGSSIAGGVSAGGDSHTGDDNCNCN